MKTDEDDIERRLRAFRPRRPAVLPDERLQLLRGPIWLAVAGGIAAVMLIASWMQKPAAPQSPDTTLGTPARTAIETAGDLDATLLQISRTALPDVTRPGGALERLAKL